MSFDRFTHEGHQQAYQLPSGAQHAQLQGSHYQRDTPRYDPHAASHAVNSFQLLGHTPSEGGAGTTFSVQITDIYNDPRTFNFVFGQKKVGAFRERARGHSGHCILVTQVPHYRETNWWSNKVPVYLLLTNSQTGEDLMSLQVCEFTFLDSPAARKRTREDLGLSAAEHGSPIKRPSSQPIGGHGHMSSITSLPNPAYSSILEDSYHPGHRQHSSQAYSMPAPHGQPPQRSISYDYHNRSTPKDYGAQNPMLMMPYAVKTEQDPERYIAVPRDQYPGQLQASQSSSYAHMHHVSGSPDKSGYYQGSMASPVTWKGQSSTGSVYVSPPPSSTLSKSDIPYSESSHLYPAADDGAEGNAPPLQRTSTLASDRSSGPQVATPLATQPPGWIPASRVKLEVMGDLEDMARNWTAEEFAIRRRLVQVWRRQDGNVIRINFRPVEPGASRPPHAVVISCIYWEERQECYFTSVDAIYLLESLIGNRFAVEEKNRIRRNLEGFRPLTVSKGKQDSENFFKLIMGFPAPKPRNIEKDVKAFPWRILTSALKKIISKYSANYGTGLSERTGEEGSRDSDTPPMSAEMPPPSIRRLATTDSSTSSTGRTAVDSGTIDDQGRPSAKSFAASFSDIDISTPHQARPRTTSPSPSARLSIRVPPTGDSNLPILDSAVSSSHDFERRSSSAGIPLSGISNLDFSDFMFSSTSESPSLSSLFPPPSALGFGPDIGIPTSAPQQPPSNLSK